MKPMTRIVLICILLVAGLVRIGMLGGISKVAKMPVSPKSVIVIGLLLVVVVFFPRGSRDKKSSEHERWLREDRKKQARNRASATR